VQALAPPFVLGEWIALIGHRFRDQTVVDAVLAFLTNEDCTTVEILTTLKNAYVDDWLSSKPDDKEQRERLYIAAQVVDDFAKNMRIILERGAITKAIIKRKQDREGL